MKKLFGLSALALMLAFNANAQVDLTKAANDLKTAADVATAKVEAAKANVAAEKQNAVAEVEAKKAEVESAVAAKESDADDVKDEQSKAIEDAKASLNNLQNALSE